MIALAASPVRADEGQDIGIITAIDAAHKTITCDCAANTLADMSTAIRHKSVYKVATGTSFSISKPFPGGDDPATFAKIKRGKSAIVEYHLVGQARVLDSMTVQSEDCRPKFCGR